MSFLNPLFLAGLLAVSIPVIIHLLSRKKPRKINFSDLRFLELASRRAIKKFRIKQYLLLLLRCLSVIALTFLFARPVIHYVASSENSETILLIDNSYSMDYLKDGISRLETAKESAKKILEMLKPFEKVAVFSFSDNLNPVVKEPTTDRKVVVSELEKIKTDYRKTRVVYAIDKTLRSFGKKSEKRIIVISDFAKNGWEDVLHTSNDKCKIIAIDVGNDNPKNFAISDISEDNGRISAGISNFSDTKKILSSVIYIDGSKYKSAFFNTDPNKTNVHTFNIKNISHGIHKASWETEPDKLSHDNRVFFAFDYQGKPRILLVDGKPHFSDFKGEIFFLKTAISEDAVSKVINYNQLDDEQLNGYSAIFLCNVSEFSRNTAIKLNKFISEGKNIVFFLGDNINTSAYNTSISFLLPCEISSAVSGGKLSNFGLPEDDDILKDITISKRFLLKPKDNSDILLKFEDGMPMLVKGKNNVFVFAVSSNLSYSDIPIKPVFPVIITQLQSHFFKKEKMFKTVYSGTKYSQDTVSGITLPNGDIIKSPVDFVFEKPGIYEVSYKNRRTEFVSVNVDSGSGEADLSKVKLSKIKKILDKMFTGVIQADKYFEKNLKKILYGSEITKIFALLLLLFFIAETLIARSQEKP
ncbi:MAG: BatA and WFA domain-containing protein [Elusimicrobia bacterium]|nr:BatA and WFA domain-containing protein [Elusimicrobiota bacterium]